MQLYLPIAEMPVNVFVILGLGLAVGFISGMFGVGGGFLTTPLLMFIGIPPSVAVATVTCHITGTSLSGAISYWRRRAVDPVLVAVLLVGGILGAAAGVWVFAILRAIGQLGLTIALSYVTLLGIVGSLMITESVRAIVRTRQGRPAEVRRPGTHPWFHGLPMKLRFKQSKIYASVIPICMIGFLVEFVSILIGIGGGFLVVPALIYLMRVPTSVVIGSSMALTLATMAVAIVMHAATNQQVDAVLGLTLIVGGVIGAQFGVRAGQAMRAEQLRLLLGLLVLGVAIRVAADLIATPTELFTVSGGSSP